MRAKPSIGHQFQDSHPILDQRPYTSACLCEEKFKLLMSDLNTAIDAFLPHRVIRKHPTDCPGLQLRSKGRSIEHANLYLFIKEKPQWPAYRL